MANNYENYRCPDPYYPDGRGETCGVGQQGYGCYNRGAENSAEEGLSALDVFAIGSIAVVLLGMAYAMYVQKTKGFKFRK